MAGIAPSGGVNRSIQAAFTKGQSRAPLRCYNPSASRRLKRDTMDLSPGARVSSFEILAPLGVGGMGEVYRARDTRLAREVAVKFLPNDVAGDADRLARFTREAQLLASLNHPNIAAIYSVEETARGPALVLELVNGPTLADRLGAGPIAVNEVFSIARQIVDALDAAHSRGLIHRDLKPANVKLTCDGTVKVLDFGLAKALAGESVPDDVNGRAAAGTATHLGVILGTPAYMSPEQATGRSVDRRTDIWAFGCLLFEMLTGRRPFDGNTISEVVAKVLEREPDWTLLPASVPTALVRLMRHCIEKDHRRRMRDIGDVRLVLDDVESDKAVSETTDTRSDVRRTLSWAVSVALGIAVIVIAMSQRRGPAQPVQQPVQLQIELPVSVHLAVDTEHPVIALSPDGTLLVFVGDENGTRRLYLRRLAEPNARPIAGTEGAASPFFSPDSAWIGYYSGWTLAKVAVGGGIPVAAQATTAFAIAQGASWAPDGSVVIAVSVNSGLMRGSMSDDRLQPITAIKPITRPDLPYAWPSVLPDGRHVLFTDNTGTNPAVAVLKLDDGSVKLLVNGATNPRYSTSGHILFARSGSVYAAPFDAQHIAITGAEQKILDGVMTQADGAAQFSVASNNTLAYITGAEVPTSQELVWVDRQGNTEPLSDAREVFLAPRFSPDGRQLVLASFEGSNLDVWRLDVARGALTRVTTHPGEDFSPVWSPDGRTLALASEIGEDRGEMGPALAWTTSDGRVEQLVRSPANGDWEFPSSWSPDGMWIAYLRAKGAVSRDVLLFPARGGSRQPIAFADSPANEYAAMFSPDGRWIAYVSDQSNRPEVYVAPFPGPGQRIQISVAGGTEPVWARNGRELFYREGNKLMAVSFPGGSIDAATAPRALFEARFEGTNNMGAETANYDVSPDGRRFVMARRKNLVAPRVIHVVLNWREALIGHAR
jgi:eukaryotic-like serine/threonine-protein kinase